MKLKTPAKLLLFGLIVGGGVFTYRQLVFNGTIPRPNILKSVIPVKAEEINAQVLTRNTNVKAVDLGTNKPMQPCMDGNTRNCINGPVHEIETWAWSANGSLFVATGGAEFNEGNKHGIQTAVGSLMAKRNVNVRIVRQDDTNQMKQDLIDTHNRLKSDPNASGIKFVTIMGDQGHGFFEDLKKLCPTCEFEVTAILGYSRGEDGFYGPAKAKNDCEALRGGVGIAVVREGDWNIALKKLGQCNIPNNPDETVYDPQGFNWINAPDYLKAVEMVIQPGGYCVELPVKGKLGGGKQKVCAEYVATWTPGDVTLAKKKGGFVPIMTTRQSVFQMPCTLIGIKQWNAAHRQDIENLLAASFEAADQMHSNPAAMQRFGEISTLLYREQDPAYWMRYYRGVTEPDATGVPVQLGGSTVSNLADNLQAFGLNGGPNLFAATYNTFGKILSQQYPKLYPTAPAVEKVLNTSYVQGVKAKASLPVSNAENVMTATASTPMRNVEGKKDYAIQFASGSADILPVSKPVLNQVADELMITNYIVALHGHTDNTGNPMQNQDLSELRAKAVETYLRSRGVQNVIRSYGHGQDEPVADNATAAGKAKNRRVQIVVGQ